MARGFKDKEGRFHPTDRTQPKMPSSFHDGSKKMGIDGLAITKQILKQTEIFARKRADQFKTKQKEIKDRQIRELQLRKSAEKRIISSFKRARNLKIKDPVALKNQILIDVPEIEDNRENLKFIENILNGFINREKRKDKEIKKAKTDEQKISIQESFDRAEGEEEKEVRDEIRRVVARQEKEISKKESKEIEKLKKQKKESDEQIQKIEKDAQELIKNEVDVVQAENLRDEKIKETEIKAIEAEKRGKVVTFADSPDVSAEIKEGLRTDRFVGGETAVDALLKAQEEVFKAQEKVETKTDEAEEKRDDVEDLLDKVGVEQPFEVDESSFPLEII